jgi:hypothetical protein
LSEDADFFCDYESEGCFLKEEQDTDYKDGEYHSNYEALPRTKAGKLSGNLKTDYTLNSGIGDTIKKKQGVIAISPFQMEDISSTCIRQK